VYNKAAALCILYTQTWLWLKKLVLIYFTAAIVLIPPSIAAARIFTTASVENFSAINFFFHQLRREMLTVICRIGG
jgi:uncharacterized membrane protein